jgi:hypothetical protein
VGDDLASYCGFRRKLVLIAVFVMKIIGTYQYSWSLLASAIVKELQWSLAAMRKFGALV